MKGQSRIDFRARVIEDISNSLSEIYLINGLFLYIEKCVQCKR